MSRSELNIRFKLSTDDFRDVRALTEWAYAQTEYDALTPEDIAEMRLPDDDFQFDSGSNRFIDVLDIVTDQNVVLWETIITATKEGQTEDTQRLVFIWDDETTEEVDLDSGEILYSEDQLVAGQSLQERGKVSRENIFRILMAAADDAV